MSPEKREACANVSVTGNTIAQGPENMARRWKDKLCEKLVNVVTFAIAAKSRCWVALRCNN